jgi:hypothetical protein
LTTTTTGTPGVLKIADPLFVLGNLTFLKGTFDNQLASAAIKVAGNATMRNAVVSMGASTITVSGDFDQSLVTVFNHNNSTVIMNGNGKTLTSYEGANLYNVVITGTPVYLNAFNTFQMTFLGSLDIYGTGTLTTGSMLVLTDMRVFPGGVIDGDDRLVFYGGSGISRMDGRVATLGLQFENEHFANISSGTYESPNVYFVGGGDRVFRFKAGTYRFTGDVAINVYNDVDPSNYEFDLQTNSPDLIFEGDLIYTPTGGRTYSWKRGTGTIAFSSNTTQSVDLKGSQMERIVSSNTSSGGLVFKSSFTTPSLFVNTSGLSSAATVYFAGGSTFTISTFTVNGNATYPVVLRSTSATVNWLLNNTNQNSVSYVDVSRSNASAGAQIVDYPGGVDNGNNSNWLFAGPDTGVRYWVAQGTSSWSSAANWSTISGGSAFGGVPTSTHTVIFDANSKGNALMVANVSVATITISGSTATIKTQSYDLTLSSGFSQSSGRIELGTSVVTMSGTNWAETGGVFDAGTSTVQFKLDVTTSSILSTGSSFYHLVLTTTTATTPGVLKIADPLYVLGNLTFLKGTFDNQLASADIKVAGNVQMSNDLTKMGASTWTLSGNFDYAGLGTFASNASRLDMNGTSKTLRTKSTFAERMGYFVPSGSITLLTSVIVEQLIVPGTITVSGVNLQNGGGTGGETTRIQSTGRVTGTGTLMIQNDAAINQMDGVIDVQTLSFEGNHQPGGDQIITATYNSPLVLFSGEFGSSRSLRLNSGTYVFTGSVTVQSAFLGTYVVDNSVSNPNLVIGGNFKVTWPHSVTWTRGTGTITMSST